MSINSLTETRIPEKNDIYDVIIIGAGPVGLATAIGLYQRGIKNFLVIDQTRSFRQVGQVVDLLPNGLRSIKAIDLATHEALKQNGINLNSPSASHENSPSAKKQQKSAPPSRQWIQMNLQGQPIGSISLEYDDWLQKYGEGRISISWYNMQTTFRNQLPSSKVRANHRCVNLVENVEAGYVRIDCVSDLETELNPYAHWIDNSQPVSSSSDSHSQKLSQHSFYAKLVVAADGINSQVRQILYKDSPYWRFAQPEYSGFAAIGGFGLSGVPEPLLKELSEKFFQVSPLVTLINDQLSPNAAGEDKTRMILIHKPDGTVGYLLHLALPLSALKEKNGTELINLVVQQLKQLDFPDCIQQVVKLANPDNLIARPYYIHRAMLDEDIYFPSTACLHPKENTGNPQPPWSQRRVVLIGDAAHGMPPFMAQGANQGLEDAFVMTKVISKIQQEQNWDNVQAIEDAFQNYEQLRRPLIAYIQEATLEQFSYSSEANLEYEKQVYSRKEETGSQKLPLS